MSHRPYENLGRNTRNKYPPHLPPGRHWSQNPPPRPRKGYATKTLILITLGVLLGIWAATAIGIVVTAIIKEIQPYL